MAHRPLPVPQASGRTTYEQRMSLTETAWSKSAAGEFAADREEEAGDWEAEVTVQVTDNAAGRHGHDQTALFKRQDA